jgi:chromosome segregation ATPase
MSKERLEAIRHYYREMESFDPGTQSDINWLIEQAERVQELEEINIDAITQIDVTQRRNEKLEKRVQELEKEIEDWRAEVQKWQRFLREESQQNKRYREALEFYADENNYFVDISKLELPEDIFYAEPPVVNERGIKARQALEETK